MFGAGQTSPTHLRLTLIDSGYLNPSDKTATVRFKTVKPKAMTNLLTQEAVAGNDRAALMVRIPCGLFRFIDIDLEQPFVAE